jgi:transposase InsO family protein
VSKKREDFNQLQLRFINGIQERYEIIRPLVLFEDITVEERSRQTKRHPQAIRKHVKRFKAEGMRGLFDKRGGNYPDTRTVPEEVKEEIFGLKSMYEDLGYREIERIIYHNLSYRINHSTVKEIIEKNPHRIQYELLLRYKDYDDPLTARIEVVKLYYQGWKVKSISGYIGFSESHIYRLLNTFAEEHFAGLHSKKRGPKNPLRKRYLPLMRKVYLLQRERPGAGRFRIWGKLRNEFEVSEQTIGRIMATNRKLYPELTPQKARDDIQKRVMPYRAKTWHQFWFIDVRYLDRKINNKQVYSICLLEGYSRAILAGTVSFKQDLWAILKVFYSACLSRGLPKAIVSDNAGVFISGGYLGICDRLGIKVEHITKGHPWENLIEAFFGIESRLADFQFNKASDFEEINQFHIHFIDDYNNTPHWAHKNRIDKKLSPLEVLGWVRGDNISEPVLHRAFNEFMFPRMANSHGNVFLHNLYFYVEAGVAKRKILLWIYQDQLNAEFADRTLAQYKCVYDKKEQKLLSLSDPSYYHTEVASPQLILFSPEVFNQTRVVLKERMRKSKMEFGMGMQQLLAFEVVAQT